MLHSSCLHAGRKRCRIENGFHNLQRSASHRTNYPVLILNIDAQHTSYHLPTAFPSESANMMTRASTRTSTVLDSQRTQPRSQEGPKPFNKRSAKSNHGQATPAKVRKLSHSEAAARKVDIDHSTKALASALKRQQGSLSSESKFCPAWYHECYVKLTP